MGKAMSGKLSYTRTGLVHAFLCNSQKHSFAGAVDGLMQYSPWQRLSTCLITQFKLLKIIQAFLAHLNEVKEILSYCTTPSVEGCGISKVLKFLR